MDSKNIYMLKLYALECCEPCMSASKGSEENMQNIYVQLMRKKMQRLCFDACGVLVSYLAKQSLFLMCSLGRIRWCCVRFTFSTEAGFFKTRMLIF